MVKAYDSQSMTTVYTLTFQATLANTNVSQTTINTSGLSGYRISEIEATDTAGGTYDEVQTVELDNASGGTFRLAFNGCFGP